MKRVRAWLREGMRRLIRAAVRLCDSNEQVAEMLGDGPCKRCIGQVVTIADMGARRALRLGFRVK